MRAILIIFMVGFATIASITSCYAENISRLIIRIEIDPVKQGDHNWDTINPFGREPDPIGKIVVYSNKGAYTKNIQLQNTFNIEEMFTNVDMAPGDKILIDLEDRDRGRWNDTICKGDIRWNGEPHMEVRHGLTTVKLDFII